MEDTSAVNGPLRLPTRQRSKVGQFVPVEDADLLAVAMGEAERWERTIQHPAYKGECSNKVPPTGGHHSHSGPSRRHVYSFLEANGDLLAYRIEGGRQDGRRVRCEDDRVPASWYGDDYGTGRHYEHTEAQAFVTPVLRGMGQTARTGQVVQMVLSPLGQYEYRYDVWPDHPEWGQMIVSYDRPTRSVKRPSSTGRKLGRKSKASKLLDTLLAEHVDTSALWDDGTSRERLNQRVE